MQSISHYGVWQAPREEEGGGEPSAASRPCTRPRAAQPQPALGQPAQEQKALCSMRGREGKAPSPWERVALPRGVSGPRGASTAAQLDLNSSRPVHSALTLAHAQHTHQHLTCLIGTCMQKKSRD